MPLVLSGGLTPDNVAEAIAATHPFAVDSASGTEAAPGRKDPARLEALLPRGGPGGLRAPEGRRVSTVEQRFGPYGGRYVPETLIPALDELERAWLSASSDPGFQLELSSLLRDYVGRPTPALPRAPPLRGAPGATCT